MTIRRFDPGPELEELADDLLAAARRVIASGRLLLGPETEAFERTMAAQLGGECVAVGSGTVALLLALLSLDVGPGDEVITVANAGVPGAAAIRATGATPVFVDIDPSSCLMNAKAAATAVTARTRAVVVVHLYGNMADVDALRGELGREIPIVEDCAQAHGATFNRRLAGTFGDLAAFSFYPTKNLGALGDAGLVRCATTVQRDRLVAHRMYGVTSDGMATLPGTNARMDEFQAAFLRVKLPRLEAANERRRELTAIYEQHLPQEVERVRVPRDCTPAPHLMVIRTPRRDALRQHLLERGIEAGIHYPRGAHTMPAFQTVGASVPKLPETQRACAEVLSLPLYPQLGNEAVLRVCTALSEFR